MALRTSKTSEFRPLIFLSHSARNDPNSHKQLKALEKALTANGFDVLLDETRLEGGEPWRNCLHTWMGHCRGAIVLLTAKALKSPWVLKEATVLSWRKSLSPDFIFIPIFLGIHDSDVRQSETFAPLDLTETQALKDLTPKRLDAEVVRLLEPLKQLRADTPRRLLEEKVANLLESIKRPALLDSVITALGEDLGPWNPNRDLRGRTAMLLLQAKPAQLCAAFRVIASTIPRESMAVLVDILSVAWINAEMAAMLLVASGKPPGRRAAAVNASMHEFTTRALIARACAQHPPWDFVPIAESSGEDVEGSVTHQVAAALIGFLGKNDEKLLELYLKDLQPSAPTMVVLPPPGSPVQFIADTEFEALLQRFKRCTFLILSGAKECGAAEWKSATRLTPPFGEDDERRGYLAFDEMRRSAGVKKT